MKYDTWTVNDEGVANYQGWTLTSEPIELKRVKRTSIFESDEQAWLHVYNGFLAGDKVCKKALMILAEESIVEFKRIKSWGETCNTSQTIE